MRVRDKTHYRTHAFKGTPETAGDVQDGLDTRGRVHFGSEGGAPNGNMAPSWGGGLKVLELQLHST